MSERYLTITFGPNIKAKPARRELYPTLIQAILMEKGKDGKLRTLDIREQELSHGPSVRRAMRRWGEMAQFMFDGQRYVRMGRPKS